MSRKDIAAFVRQILPHARRAAAALDVDPRGVVAQAALETGWGRKLPRHPDGSSSFNVFGIKADRRWQGAFVLHRTTEYENGVLCWREETFRAYGGLGEAFADYARFLLDSPRYAPRLASARDPETFARALQAGGYATDPAYAEKIARIAGSDHLRCVDDLSAPDPGGLYERERS